MTNRGKMRISKSEERIPNHGRVLIIPEFVLRYSQFALLTYGPQRTSDTRRVSSGGGSPLASSAKASRVPSGRVT